MLNFLWQKWTRQPANRKTRRVRKAFRRAQLGMEQLEVRENPSTGIVVPNFSFENPAIPAGTNNVGGGQTIQNWTVMGTGSIAGANAGVVHENSAVAVTTGTQHGELTLPAHTASANVATITAISVPFPAGGGAEPNEVLVTANNSFSVGQLVTIAGVTNTGSGTYNGTFAVTGATSTTFTYQAVTPVPTVAGTVSGASTATGDVVVSATTGTLANLAANTTYTISFDLASTAGSFQSAGNDANNNISLIVTEGTSGQKFVLNTTAIPSTLPSASKTTYTVSFDSSTLFNHAGFTGGSVGSFQDPGEYLSAQISVGKTTADLTNPVSLDFDNVVVTSAADVDTTTTVVHNTGGTTPGSAITYNATVTPTTNTQQISAATWASGTATLTVPNAFVAGDSVTVAGLGSSGPGSYNGAVTVISSTGTTFKYAVASNPGTVTASTLLGAATVTNVIDGAVQFYDNGVAFGSPVTANINGGSVTVTSPSHTIGTVGDAASGHQIRAQFVPTSANGLNSSGYYAENIQSAGFAFTSGDLIVDTAGNGVDNLNTSAAPVYLNQFTTTGTAQGSTILPLSSSGANNAFSFAGSTLTEGYLQQSADGRYLVLAGYQAKPGTAGVGTSTVAADPREVALIPSTGVADTSTAINNAYDTKGFVAATSLDGQAIYTAGEDGGGAVHLAADGNLTSSNNIAQTTAVSSAGTSTNIEDVNIVSINGQTPQLVASSQLGFTGLATVGPKAPAAYPSTLPTLAGQTFNALSAGGTGFNNAGLSPEQFYFVPTNTGTPSAPVSGDKVYIADSSTAQFPNGQGGLQLWQFNGSQWVQQGYATPGLNGDGTGPVNTTGVASEIYGIAAFTADPSNPGTFYAVTTKTQTLSPNNVNYLIKIVDTGFNGSTETWSYTLVATSSPNTLFHGVAFAPKTLGATASTVSLSSSTASANYGTGITFTATPPATATGYITFESADGNTIYGVVPIDPVAHTAQIILNTASNPLPLGSNSVVAYYGGDQTFAKSNSTASPTTVTINSISAAPVFTSALTTNSTINLGTTFQLSAYAAGDTTAITFGQDLANPPPSWVNVSPSGLITVNPDASRTTSHVYTFDVTASNDSGANVTTQTFTLNDQLIKTFTGGDLVVLQAGDGVNAYNNTAPLYLDEIKTTSAVSGTNTFTSGQVLSSSYFTSPSSYVQPAIPIANNQATGGSGNQPITLDVTAAAGNGQLNRSYDGSVLSFGGLDSATNSITASGGGASRDIAIVGTNAGTNYNSTTYGTFDSTDDNRGAVVDTTTGGAASTASAIYNVGHSPNGGTRYFATPGASNGVQVDDNVSKQNSRGVTIGFNNTLYWSTAGKGEPLGGSAGTAGIYTASVTAGALPTVGTTTTPLSNPISNATFSTVGSVTTVTLTVNATLLADVVYGSVIKVSGLTGTGLSGYNGTFRVTAIDTVHSTISYVSGTAPTGTGAVTASSVQIYDTLLIPVNSTLPTSDRSYEDINAKLGGVYIADMNGDGKLDTGDRIYYVDDGSVNLSHSGVYVSTYNGTSWSQPFNLGDAPSPSLGGPTAGQLRGLTGSIVSPTEVQLYATSSDNVQNNVTWVLNWDDKLSAAQTTGNTDTVVGHVLQGMQNVASSDATAKGASFRGLAFAPTAATSNTLTASSTSTNGTVTLTATLVNSSGNPTGMVGFLEDGAPLSYEASQTLVMSNSTTSKATYTVKVSGTHNFSAYYDSGTFAQQGSNTLSVQGTYNPGELIVDTVGTAPSVNIASITKAASGSAAATATIVTSSNHNLVTGQAITIAGATTGYNSADIGAAGSNGLPTYTVTVINATTFTISLGNNQLGLPNETSPAGTITLALNSTAAQATLADYTTAGVHNSSYDTTVAPVVSSVTPTAISVSSGLVTVTVASALPAAFAAGQSIVVSGVTSATASQFNAYDGTFVITAVPTTTTFTYYVPVRGSSQPTAAGVVNSNSSVTIATSALTEGGTSSSEGYNTLSADGHTVGIAGYQQAIGGSTNSTENTVGGVLSPNQTINTSTQLPSQAGSVKAVVSPDGLGMYVATAAGRSGAPGTVQGIFYVPFGNTPTNAYPVTSLPATPTYVAGNSSTGGTVAVTIPVNNPTTTSPSVRVFNPGQIVSVNGILTGGTSSSSPTSSNIYTGIVTIVSVTSTSITFWAAAPLGTNLPASQNVNGAVVQVLPTAISNEFTGANPGQAANTVSIQNGSQYPANNPGVPGQLYDTVGLQFQNSGLPSVDGPIQVGTGLSTSAGQAVNVIGKGSGQNWPAFKDVFGNFPTTGQISVSPDGKTIYVADGRTDGNGGILEYYLADPLHGTWLRPGNLQLDSFQISSVTEPNSQVSVTGASYANGIATITTSGTPTQPFLANQSVTVAGITGITGGTGTFSFNGSFNILSVGTNQFTFLLGGAPTTTTSFGFASSTATVSTSVVATASTAVDYQVGQPIVVSGIANPLYNSIGQNGSGNILGVVTSVTNGGLNFTYNVSTPGQLDSGPGSFNAYVTSADGGLSGLTASYYSPTGVALTNPIIYATTTGTSGNHLVKITGGTLDGSTPSFAVTYLDSVTTQNPSTPAQVLSSGLAFRGVSFAPVAAGTTATTTTLALTSLSSEDYDTGVTLTATVNNSAATGYVSFRVGGVEIGSAPVISGVATFNTKGQLSAGAAVNVDAYYTGDSTYAPSNSTGTGTTQSVTITQSSTTGAVTFSTPNVASGSAVTITDTITPIVGGGPTVATSVAPTGTVTFSFSNGDASVTVPVTQVILNNGTTKPTIAFQANLPHTFTGAAGSVTVTATYSGDTNYKAPVTAPTGSLNISNPTVVTVTSSAANPATGSTLTFTAQVTDLSNSAAPGGTVQFYDDLLPIGQPQTVPTSSTSNSSNYQVTISTAPVDQVTITSAVGDANGTVTVTTNSANAYTAGNTVTIVGIPTGASYTGGPSGYVGGFNGTFTILATPTANTFTYADAAATSSSDSVGGMAIAGSYVSGSFLAGVLTPGKHAISAVYTPTAGSTTFAGNTGVHEQSVQPAAFGPSDVFVERNGDGISPLNTQSPNPVLGSIGATVYMDELNSTTGALIQSIALPTADSQQFGLVAPAGAAGATATLVTTAPTDYVAGQIVTISNVAQTGYNGDVTLLSVTPTTAPSGGPASMLTYLATSAVAGSGTPTVQGVDHAVVGDGQQSTTGQVTRSGDGQFLFLTGYDNNPLPYGTALPVPTATGSNSVPRAIARIKYDGTIDTEAFNVGTTGIGTGGNFNSVVSPDGNSFVVGGSGIYAFPSFTKSASRQGSNTISGSTPSNQISGSSSNGLEFVNGNLYNFSGTSITQIGTGVPGVVSQITNATFDGTTATITVANNFTVGEFVTVVGVTGATGYNSPTSGNTPYWTVSAASPTSFSFVPGVSISGTPAFTTGSFAQPAAVQLPGFTSLGSQPYAIGTAVDGYFTHESGTPGNAPDTLYVSDASNFGQGSISKWTLSGGNWSEQGGYSYGFTAGQLGFYYLAGTTSSGSATLYNNYGNGGNTDFGPGYLYKVTDTSGAGNPIPVDQAVPTLSKVSQAQLGGPYAGNMTYRGVALAPAAAVQSVVVNGIPQGTITTIVGDGTNATVTVTAPTAFVAGEVVTIATNSVTGFNGQYKVTGASNPAGGPYTFTYANATAATTGTGGTATFTLSTAQRSMVDAIVYKFNQPVTLGAGAFTITAPVANAGLGQVWTTGVVPTQSYTSVDGGLTWVLTFPSGTGGSIGDGYYNIVLNPSAVTYNTSGAVFTQNFRGTDGFYRLFGDNVGNQTVNGTDKIRFNNAFGLNLGAPNYNEAFDYSGVQNINGTAKIRFNNNFGKTFSGMTLTI